MSNDYFEQIDILLKKLEKDEIDICEYHEKRRALKIQAEKGKEIRKRMQDVNVPKINNFGLYK
jgi:hypothetical protein